MNRTPRAILRAASLLLAASVLPGAVEAQDGARSYTISPNERIHVIQRKVELLEDKLEVTLYPVTAQLNSRWTQHLGQGLAVSRHLTESFAVQGLFAYNGVPFIGLAQETDLQDELRNKAQLQPPSAPSVITQWYAIGSLEMAPIYGKIAYYKDAMMHFSMFLTAGAGVVGSKVQIISKPAYDDDPNARGPVFADAGMRAAGLVGAGFRVHLNDQWMVRVEIRDLIYSARIDRLNGCSLDELNAVQSGGVPGSSCDLDAFEAEYRGTDAAVASHRTDSSSDTVNQVSAYVGFSYLF